MNPETFDRQVLIAARKQLKAAIRLIAKLENWQWTGLQSEKDFAAIQSAIIANIYAAEVKIK